MGTEMVRPSSKSTVKVSSVTTTVKALLFLNTVGIDIGLLAQADPCLRGVGTTSHLGQTPAQAPRYLPLRNYYEVPHVACHPEQREGPRCYCPFI